MALKKINLILMIVLLISMLVLFGCTRARVLASVNGDRILEKDLEQNIDYMIHQDAGGMLAEDQEQLVVARSELLDTLIVIKLIRQYAEEAGIEACQQEIEARFENIIFSFDSREEFEQEMENRGISEDFLRTGVQTQIIGDMVYDHINEQITITDAQAKQFYQENKGRMFVEAEKVRVSHILAQFKQDQSTGVPTDDEKQQAMEKIEMVRNKLEEGKPFEQAAREYSDDQDSAGQGGDIGLIRDKRFQDRFEQAAFALEIGELSDIVKTSSGYHLLIITERQEAYIKDFEQVKEVASAYVQDDLEKEAWTSLLGQLIEDADIKYHTDIKGTLGAVEG